MLTLSPIKRMIIIGMKISEPTPKTAMSIQRNIPPTCLPFLKFLGE
ncbi:hypothetical protein GCM10008902_31000 [[Clostridium] innocuum]